MLFGYLDLGVGLLADDVYLGEHSFRLVGINSTVINLTSAFIEGEHKVTNRFASYLVEG